MYCKTYQLVQNIQNFSQLKILENINISGHTDNNFNMNLQGVTYCGESKASKLTMQNVPWHQEVLDFCQQLTAGLEGDEYEIACEHEHSNCVLIARTKVNCSRSSIKRLHSQFRVFKTRQVFCVISCGTCYVNPFTKRSVNHLRSCTCTCRRETHVCGIDHKKTL